MTALTLAANHDHAGTWAIVTIACLICAWSIARAIRHDTATTAANAAWDAQIRADRDDEAAA